MGWGWGVGCQRSVTQVILFHSLTNKINRCYKSSTPTNPDPLELHWPSRVSSTSAEAELKAWGGSGKQ